MMLIQHSVNSDWLLNTQSRVLQADWFILEINEKATLNINMSYYSICFSFTRRWLSYNCHMGPYSPKINVSFLEELSFFQMFVLKFCDS